ncbi:DHA2 family multidrug resistance protein-like MFS transporter [Nocardia tenerifensis]|uniref:DHA2 family multidrug resistance protein-like MFS transporter n=1 Tax=Nocardia tenerifensis TaxID=228006 RepID=A0A318KBX4_9NOCA|nr:MFS transporter [Nocardia tenerifensis]PXX69252.1 DHA2 family multidrug resistance protein-like MFS transporter [Nocardia tenerifensis]
MTDSTTDAANAPFRAWLGLAVLVLSALLVALDMSVLHLGMPSVAMELHPSATADMWIIDIYGFSLAALLVTMGNIGDRIGRRRILMLGALVFGAASALAAFSSSVGVLIAARALLGIGGAMLLPASLALVSNVFPAGGRARSAAVGIWTAFFAGGAAAGSVIGGTLLYEFWWGSVFLINLPVVLIVLVAAPLVLPEYREAYRGPLDVLSVGLFAGAVLPLVYAVKRAAVQGLDPVVAGTALVGLGVLLWFVDRQRRLAAPLLDLSLLRRPAFAMAIAAASIGAVSWAGMTYLTCIYRQSVLECDVLDAALLGIPMAAAVFAAAVVGVRIGSRWGAARTILLALGAAAAGNLVLVAVGAQAGLPWYVAGSTTAGLGYGVLFTFASDAAVSAVPAAETGAAAGISETSLELGSGLGISLLGSLTMTLFRSGGHFASTLEDTVAGAHGDPTTIDSARNAFVSGMHIATIVSVAAVVITASAIWVLSARKEK